LSVVEQHSVEYSPLIVSEAGVSDYIALLKPRVMSLVVFTALVGLVIAPGHLHPVLAITSILCIAVGGGASGALNMWYERDIDALMTRTANRPLPRGRISSSEAAAFGTTLAIFSVATLGILVNWLAGALLAFTIFFYVVVYTMWLKRWTAQNIVIGGAAGALPPVVAWAAATGSLAPQPIILFLIIFLWTPPHFWVMFIGVNLVFFPKHFLGLSGMPRRYIDYPDAFAGWNLVSSIGSYIAGFGVLIFLYGVVEAFAKKRIAGNNPWGPGATTLEWTLTSPPPFHQFEVLPRIQ